MLEPFYRSFSLSFTFLLIKKNKMLDFSITLTVSSGIVAAFVFCLFEVLIFPLTLFATSTLAALTMQRRGKKGKPIKIRGIVFPLWSEGLLNGQRTHWILLGIRIIIVGIPVYLETRVQAEEQPLYETVVFPHTFEVNPVTNWVNYMHNAKNNIGMLRRNAAMIGNRCLHYREDRFVDASVANVSYFLNGQAFKVSCLNGTERRILKARPYDLPEELEEQSRRPDGTLFIKGNLSLNISISFGTVDSFQPTVDSASHDSDLIFRVNRITALNNPHAQCFSENNFNPLHNISSVPLKIMCQMKSADLLLYLTAGAPNRTVKADFGLHGPKSIKNNTIENAYA